MELLNSHQPSTFSLPSLPQVLGTNLSTCALDGFRIAIAQLLANALGIPIEKAYEGVDYGKKGEDFTVALPRFRLPGKVDDWAKKVIEKFTPNGYLQCITQDKGFLHFRLNTTTMIKAVLTQVYELTQDSEGGQSLYGHNKTGKGKKVIIEYSSPNIAKSFHVGHLRSTILGAFLANLYKTCGWEVISMNYLGDWGTQCGMIATGFKKYGSQEALEAEGIKHLFDIYVQANKDAETNPQVKIDAAAWFKQLENGDPVALESWRKWRDISVKKYQADYETLNVAFDVITGESEVSKEYMDKAVERLESMGLIEESDGAKLVNLKEWNLGHAIVNKKDGTSNYLVRDIASAMERYDKHKFDKMIYVVSNQQDLHFARFFKVLELLGFEWAENLVHVNFGQVLGMSTRSGNVVFLNEVIDNAAKVMHEQMQASETKYSAVEDPETTSREIGITGIKVQDMSATKIHNYKYNKERMLALEGDAGPYLQYTHARLESLKRKNPHLLPLPAPSDLKLELLAPPHTSNHSREIAFLLGTYPDVVKTALKTHEPSGVVTFAFKLAHAISSAWDVVGVKNVGADEKEKASARLFLYFCARDVLNSAMKLLTIRPLARM